MSNEWCDVGSCHSIRQVIAIIGGFCSPRINSILNGSFVPFAPYSLLIAHCSLLFDND